MGLRGGGVCWARGSGEQQKEGIGVQKHSGQPPRSSLALGQDCKVCGTLMPRQSTVSTRTNELMP
eukprot:1146764-Pelagomonas_calceolata.AAC.2